MLPADISIAHVLSDLSTRLEVSARRQRRAIISLNARPLSTLLLRHIRDPLEVTAFSSSDNLGINPIYYMYTWLLKRSVFSCANNDSKSLFSLHDTV